MSKGKRRILRTMFGRRGSFWWVLRHDGVSPAAWMVWHVATDHRGGHRQ